MAPLTGLTVIDLTRVLAGPYCTMLLADMGAEVIKVEEPTSGDDLREYSPVVHGWSSYFLGVNRNKKSVALDLRTDSGKEALWRLISLGDVLVENFRPGSLGRLGFNYAAVHATNPALVYCSISGYGNTGPRSHLSGYDPVIQAECGLMSVTGFPDGQPARVGVAITDYLAGLYAHQGILLALMERQRTGRGQHVDVALFDAMLATLAMPAGIYEATGVVPGRLGNDHPSIAPYEVFTAKDGMIMICAANQRLWVSLCEAIGTQHLVDDARFRSNRDRLQHRPELKRAVESALAELSVCELVSRLEARSVPCGRVRTIDEALKDPQVAARSMVYELQVPGHGPFRVLGNPVKMSEAAPVKPAAPPRLGEHTEEVLRNVGYATEEIARLTQPIVAKASA